MPSSSWTHAASLELIAVPGIPLVAPGDDLSALCASAIRAAGITLRASSDVVVVSSKIVSRAEGRFVELASVVPSDAARDLAARTKKDPRFVQLVLDESISVSRATETALITRHRLGFVSANAGIDASNTGSQGSERMLLLPLDPDASARAIRQRLRAELGADVAVVVTDSHGRPFRLGTLGAAIGVAGLPVLDDHRGRKDLHGRPLEVTVTALADQVAVAADLLAGQADEGRPLIVVRGLTYELDEQASARQLVRAAREDLYA